jgi:hypothetical protein
VRDIDEARAEVRRILDADLEALTDRQRLSVVPGVAAGDWDLPAPCRRALWTHGLPPAREDGLIGVAGDFQAAREPELAYGDSRLYAIGTSGAARLAAECGSGVVLAMPGFTEQDVHPQLRDRFPHGVRPEPVNSSVEMLVDFAWRWHWILPVLAEQQIRAGKDEHDAWRDARSPAENAALPDFYAGVRELCAEVVERFRGREPAAMPDDESFWSEMVMEDL